MNGTLRPLAELVEEAAARLTSHQLHALAARVAAHELRPPEPPRPFTLATNVALDLDGTVRRLVELWGTDGIGCDLDIVAAWLLPQLLRAGVDEAAALAALERHTRWRPRTDEERERAVARAMLSDGFTPEQIARALQETAPC